MVGVCTMQAASGHAGHVEGRDHPRHEDCEQKARDPQAVHARRTAPHLAERANSASRGLMARCRTAAAVLLLLLSSPLTKLRVLLLLLP